MPHYRPGIEILEQRLVLFNFVNPYGTTGDLIAVDDVATTQGLSVVIDVAANDLWNGAPVHEYDNPDFTYDYGLYVHDGVISPSHPIERQLTEPAHGSVLAGNVLTLPNGKKVISIIYQPDPGFSGIDSFPYVIHAYGARFTPNQRDGWAGGVVNVVVTAPPLVITVNTLGDNPAINAASGNADTDASTPDIQATLRSAIEVANKRAGNTTIRFDIPSQSFTAPVIVLKSPLPELKTPMIIDATTQPNGGMVALDGSAAVATSGDPVDALVLRGGNTTIRGLIIGGFSGNGIVLPGQSDATPLGGLNTINENWIGLDGDGQAHPNGGSGIVVSSSSNTIGDVQRSKGNVIAANGKYGILLTGAAAHNNDVFGNQIGTGPDGTTNLGNTLSGIFITNEAGINLIGDNTPSDSTDSGNVIAYNHEDGVLVGSDGARGFQISAGRFNKILGNAIFANRDLAIDLGPNDGPNANNLVDTDPDLLNYPQISPPRRDVASFSVQVALNSSANQDYQVQFFAVSLPDPSNPDGVGGSSRFLGEETKTTDASGNITFQQSFTGQIAPNEYVTGTATGHFGTSEFSRPRNPLLFLPGIGGNLPKSSFFETLYDSWLRHRGTSPENLVLDPLKHTYDDLIQTLVNSGYVLDANLYAAVYDWRLPPGPTDGNEDGRIDGVTAASITSGTYSYGVDYMGYWLKRAMLDWRRDYPGFELPAVDVISHSTGGLVARTYLQSDAYNETIVVDGKPLRLPKVNNFVMMGVPNQGAAGPWMPLHNDWGEDNPTYFVISQLINASYQKVLRGAKITGPATAELPDGEINLSTIANPKTGKPDPVIFIRQYCPTLQSLLATYPFFRHAPLQASDPSIPEEYKNKLVLDLNGGSIANRFARPDKVNKAWVIYGEDQRTANTVTDLGLNRGPLWIMEGAPTFTKGDEHWYRLNFEKKPDGTGVGDGTVPAESSVGLFRTDDAINKRAFPGITHTGMFAVPDVERYVLTILNTRVSEDKISTDLLGPNLLRIVTILNDPVQGVVVDGNGKRLGYTEAEGVLTEIPGSIYLGGADGIGFVAGPVTGPLRHEVTGLDTNAYARVVGAQGNQITNSQFDGFLAQGQEVDTVLTWQDSGPAAMFQLDAPGQATIGAALSVTVIVQDAMGRPVTNYTGKVSFTSSDSTATLPAEYTFTAADNGVKTFTGIVLRKGGNQSITVTDKVNAAIVGAISLGVSGPATHFVVSVPDTAITGEPTAIVVTALDANNNVATGYTGTVHFTSSDGQSLLPANFTFPPLANGRVVFNVIWNSQAGQTINVADASNSAINGTNNTTVINAPTSTMTPLEPYQGTSIALSWSGVNPSQSVAIASYDIYVSDNGGPYTLLLGGTTQTSTEFTGTDGHTYQFFSVATDSLGRRQERPTSAQTQTTVDSVAPTSSVNPLPASQTSASVALSWSGSDNTGGSGIASYQIYVSDNGAPFTLLYDSTSDTADTFIGQYGHTYRFYSIATDGAGNRQPIPDAPQATISLINTANKVTFVAGTVFVFATDAADTIALATTTDRKKLQVTINRKVLSKTITLASIQEIRVIGRDGNDTITVTNVTRPLALDGGAGTDKFTINGLAGADTFTVRKTSFLWGAVASSITSCESWIFKGLAGNDVYLYEGLPDAAMLFDGGAGSDRHQDNTPARSTSTGTFSYLAETIVGGNSLNTLTGGNQNNVWKLTGVGSGTYNKIAFSNMRNLKGGPLDDYFSIANGAGLEGKLEAGAGYDVLDYSAWLAGVTVQLDTQSAQGIGGAVTGVNSVYGTPFADTITGNASDNVLIGHGGNDTLDGNDGSDILLGGAGNDTLTGGTGRDLLFGGSGGDSLFGGTGDDVLFGGKLSYLPETGTSFNLTASINLYFEWVRTDATFSTRVNHLLKGGGFNKTSLLTNKVALNDGTPDNLRGDGDSNWFIVNAGDSEIDTATLKTIY